MKNNELRLGNLVYRKYWNPQPENERFCLEYCIVTFISENNVNVSPINKKIKLKFKIDSGDIGPIELTEEWLIKFGFVLNTDSNSFRIFSCKEEWILSAQQMGNKTGFKIGLPINHRCDQYMTSFKYVHQLQNLYFALTGTELTHNQLP